MCHNKNTIQINPSFCLISTLLQEISQVVAEVKAQSQVVDKARRTLRDSENAMFLADQKLSKFVCEVEDATVALKVQGNLDKER